MSHRPVAANRATLAVLILKPCSEPGLGFGSFAVGSGVKGDRVQTTTATIRAVRHCELYELTKSRFNLVLQRYPDIRAKMEKEACHRLMQQERFQIGADNALKRWRRAHEKLNTVNRFRNLAQSAVAADKRLKKKATDKGGSRGVFSGSQQGQDGGRRPTNQTARPGRRRTATTKAATG